MNEQKDKLLINLVEPGRIGRTPFNSFFSLSSLFRMGELVKKKRIDGGCGVRVNWFGLVGFAFLLWVRGGSCRTAPQQRKRAKPSNQTNEPNLSFFSISFWLKREKKLREEMKAERAGKEKNTTKERENAARLNSLWVGYELAAHLRGSTHSLISFITQSIHLASLAAPQKRDKPTPTNNQRREGTQPFLFFELIAG